MDSPFDKLAAGYDQQFTETTLGRHLRNLVLDRVDAASGAGQRVLDLGCGTGHDAAHLAARGLEVWAVDAAAEMVETARAKGAAWGDRLHVLQGSIEALDELVACAGPFDLALSNFGALNCVADLPRLLRAVAARLDHGGRFWACVMGPWVPWEWVWMVFQGTPRKSFRRLRSGGSEWRGMTIRYPSVRAFRRACPKELRIQSVSSVGAFLPPTYVEPWIRQHPRWLATLAWLEQRLAEVPPFPQLADHYLVEMVRADHE